MRLFLVTLLLLPGCAAVKPVAEAVDRVCVVGRISAEQAEMLNGTLWGKLNDFLGGARENDRVVNGDCSEALREIEGRND